MEGEGRETEDMGDVEEERTERIEDKGYSEKDRKGVWKEEREEGRSVSK